MTVVARAYPAVTVEDDVLDGLRREPKRLPGHLLHEGDGAPLFEQISGVDDFYPSRVELRLLDAHLPSIAADVGAAARVLEPGTGRGIRTKRMLAALDHPAEYVTISDITAPITLPPPRRPHRKTFVFVPDATIGRFDPHDAVAILGGLQRLAGPNARLLVTADGTHDRDALLRAYDDHDGVTAKWTTHVLAYLNHTRGATFALDRFEHRAVWNAHESRVELCLVSRIGQEITVGGERFTFAADEPIITQVAYKHSMHAMRGLLGAAGWSATQVYTAQEQPVRLWLCEPRGV